MKKEDGESCVRMQIPLPAGVALILARHATELDRSHAWVACWALRIAEEYRGEIGAELGKRLQHPEKHLNRVERNNNGEVRLQLKVPERVWKWIEQTSAVAHNSPGKFAALLIDLVMEKDASVLWFMKTGPGKFMRKVLGSKEDLAQVDDAANEDRELDEKNGLEDVKAA